MEARIARLESDVAHLRTDVADIKIDLRALRDKVDAVDTKLGETKVSLERSVASAKIWMLSLSSGVGAALLGAMARGFGWI